MLCNVIKYLYKEVMMMSKWQRSKKSKM